MLCGVHGRALRALKKIYDLVRRPRSRSPSSERHAEEIFPTRSADNMAALWGDALDKYRHITGDDFRDPKSRYYELYLRLEGCSDEGAIFAVLDHEAQALDKHRQGPDWSRRLRSALTPIVNCVLAVIEVGSEMAAAKVPGGKAIFVAVVILLRAAIRVGETLQALLELLETFRFYLVCLKVYDGAPIEPDLRELIVQTLVEMLKTLAYAVKTAEHGQWVHFLRNLAGQGNKAVDSAMRTGGLLEKDMRFRVTSIHRMMTDLMASIPLVMQMSLERVENRLETIQAGIENVPAILGSGVDDLRSHINSAVAVHRWQNAILTVRLDTLTTAVVQVGNVMSSTSSGSSRLNGHSNALHLRLMGVDIIQLGFTVNGLMTGVFRMLSRAEQSAEETDDAGVTGGLSAISTFMAGFSDSLTRWFTWPFQREVLRSPDIRIESITLIDALDRRLELRVDMSWNEVHTALLEQFRVGEGLEYVRSNRYNLLLENGEQQPSVIDSDTWANVQAGTTIEMSIVIRQSSLVAQCPYCRTTTSRAAENTRIRCTGCDRSYLASVASVSESRIEEVDLSPDLDRSQLPTAAHGSSSQSTIPANPASPSPPSVSDDASVSSSTARGARSPESLTEDDDHPSESSTSSPVTPQQAADLPAPRHANDALPFKLVTIVRPDIGVATGTFMSDDGGFAASLYWESLSSPLPSASNDLLHVNNLISAARRAVDHTPDGHPEKPVRYSDLGKSYLRRFECNGDGTDIEQSIVAHRRAVDLTPDGHPEKSIRYNDLGLSLLVRFEHNGDVASIEQSIAVLRRALGLTTDGHPNKPGLYSNLGGSLAARCKHEPTQFCFDKAAQAYIDATAPSPGSSSTRLRAALQCVRLHASHPAFSSTKSLLLAHSRVIAVLPEIVWLGFDKNRRLTETAELRKSVTAAVSAAIAAGSLRQAVEWLEAGRALIWSQALSLRTPFGNPRPSLSKSLLGIQRQLRKSAANSFALDVKPISHVPGMTVNAEADHHRELSIKYGQILEEIRACVGFKSFLRPKRFDALIPSPGLLSGPVVFINVGKLRSDALILIPNGETASVTLPDLSSECAEALRAHWTANVKRRMGRGVKSLYELADDLNPFHTVLESLWVRLVNPILQALLLVKPNHSFKQLPCITWCPTGPLMQLPLHVAGIYSDPDGPRVYHFVISSYTPSLSALLRRANGVARTPEMLVITQPATLGFPPLPNVAIEGRHVRKILGSSRIRNTLLHHRNATVLAVRRAISQYSWVHFACHGGQHSGDPMQSAFALYDGSLSIEALMGSASENAELAFLSACQTATGDEGNSEESAHLAAGMLAVGFKGVVATLWSIMDADAPIVVEAYYKELIALRRYGNLNLGKGQTGAAYALHEAVRVLRERVGENQVMRWAPFVHFGV